MKLYQKKPCLVCILPFYIRIKYEHFLLCCQDKISSRGKLKTNFDNVNNLDTKNFKQFLPTVDFIQTIGKLLTIPPKKLKTRHLTKCNFPSLSPTLWMFNENSKLKV